MVTHNALLGGPSGNVADFLPPVLSPASSFALAALGESKRAVGSSLSPPFMPSAPPVPDHLLPGLSLHIIPSSSALNLQTDLVADDRSMSCSLSYTPPSPMSADTACSLLAAELFSFETK